MFLEINAFCQSFFWISTKLGSNLFWWVLLGKKVLTHPKYWLEANSITGTKSSKEKPRIKVLLLLSTEVINVGLLFIGAFRNKCKCYSLCEQFQLNDVWQNFQKLQFAKQLPQDYIFDSYIKIRFEGKEVPPALTLFSGDKFWLKIT